MNEWHALRRDLLRFQYKVRGLSVERMLKRSALIDRKFDPDQPRLPAGSPEGGRWTSGGGAGAGSLLDDLAETQGAVPADLARLFEAQYRGEYHDIVRDHYADLLRQTGQTVVTEVPLSMVANPAASARIDMIVVGAMGLYGVEVKTGDNPSYTTMQVLVYPHVETGGLVTSFSTKAAELGLVPGLPFPPIPLYTLRVTNPGMEPDVFRMFE